MESGQLSYKRANMRAAIRAGMSADIIRERL